MANWRIFRGPGGKRESIRAYTKTLLVGVGLCLLVWVALAELRLLPVALMREVEVYFEWELPTGFKTFRLESYGNNKGEPGGRVWQYLVTIQIEPRLKAYFIQSGWQKTNGHVGVNVAKVIPAAIPIALGSDGEVIYDPDETPLMGAADKGDTKAVEHLLTAGADVNARDQQGQTALIHACLRGNASPGLVSALLSAGADVNARDMEDRTPLLLAVQTPSMSAAGKIERSEVVAELLAAHSDVKAKDEKGNTALMMAAAYADAETVQALLSAGAELSAQNNEGETALSFAEAKNNTEIVRLLRRLGARR